LGPNGSASVSQADGAQETDPKSHLIKWPRPCSAVEGSEPSPSPLRPPADAAPARTAWRLFLCRSGNSLTTRAYLPERGLQSMERNLGLG